MPFQSAYLMKFGGGITALVTIKGSSCIIRKQYANHRSFHFFTINYYFLLQILPLRRASHATSPDKVRLKWLPLTRELDFAKQKTEGEITQAPINVYRDKNYCETSASSTQIKNYSRVTPNIKNGRPMTAREISANFKTFFIPLSPRRSTRAWAYRKYP